MIGGGLRWRGWKVRPGVSASFRRTNNALEFGVLNVGRRGLANVFQVTLSGEGTRRWDSGMTRVSGGVVVSPFGSDSEHGTLRPGAKARYGLLRGSIWHRYDLPKGWDVVGNVGGQWSSEPVLQGDQIALGGGSGVRGLPEQFGLGDSGVLAGLELRAPLITVTEALRVRPSVFVNTGVTFDQVNETDEAATSVGFGLQIGYGEALRASVHAGVELGEGDGNIHGQLSWRF